MPTLCFLTRHSRISSLGLEMTAYSTISNNVLGSLNPGRMFSTVPTASAIDFCSVTPHMAERLRDGLNIGIFWEEGQLKAA